MAIFPLFKGWQNGMVVVTDVLPQYQHRVARGVWRLQQCPEVGTWATELLSAKNVRDADDTEP